ncbi:MAG: hypothetical protein ACI4A8_08665 [Muribaculaceae bacterium]
MGKSQNKSTIICWAINFFSSNFYGIGILGTSAVACLLFIINDSKQAENDDFTLYSNIFTGAIAAISLILSVWAGRYTYNNFEEIWSRRKRWTSSNVEKLDARMKNTAMITIRMFFSLFTVLIVLAFLICYGIDSLLA